MDEEASSLQVLMNSEFTVKIMHSLGNNHLHALLLILKEELRTMKRHKTRNAHSHARVYNYAK